ncbi:MAG: LysR family transcriptional regulator [Gammaproteobacteria bacterium]
MDQLASMRTFARVADLSSFTRAADALELSRAVVSTQVAELERHLGVRLFHRTTRRVTLTADGSEYLERCLRILADVDAADEAAKRTRLRPQGRLRVDVPVAFGRHLLQPALPQFTERYPELSLEVQYNDRVIDLVDEEVDVAVRVGLISDKNLVARKVCRTRMVTCASPAYLAKHGTPTHPDQLASHRLIGLLSSATGKPRRWLFQQGAARKQLKLPFVLAFNNHEAPISVTIRGAGIMQTVDVLVAEGLANGKLTLLLKDWPAEGPPVSIVYPVAQRGSTKVRVFADFAADLLLRMRKRVDEILAPSI